MIAGSKEYVPKHRGMSRLPNSIYRIIIIDYLRPLYCELIAGDNILDDFLRICQSDLINEDWFPGLDIMRMICEKGNMRLFNKFIGRFDAWSYPNSEKYYHELVKAACQYGQTYSMDHILSSLGVKYSKEDLLDLIQIALTGAHFDTVTYIIKLKLFDICALDIKTCVGYALKNAVGIKLKR